MTFGSHRKGSVNSYQCLARVGAHLQVATVEGGTMLDRDSELVLRKGFSSRRERLGRLLYALLFTSLWDYCIGPVLLSQVPLVLPLWQTATPPADARQCLRDILGH